MEKEITSKGSRIVSKSLQSNNEGRGRETISNPVQSRTARLGFNKTAELDLSDFEVYPFGG